MTLSALLSLLFTICMSNTIYPNIICATGDVQADYASSRDPRIHMGSYIKINITDGMVDENIADISYPIYQHTYQMPINAPGQPIQYIIFKAKNIGWVVSAPLPITTSTLSVNMTCFQDHLFDCKYFKWYWGYNQYAYSIPTFRILSGDCNPNLCLQNLTLQLKSNVDINIANPQPGDYSKLDGEYLRSSDNTTDRYQYINQHHSSFRWYYRVNMAYDGGSATYNWVLSENAGDRVACAPGFVDSPLFCTRFVYAGADFNGQSYNPTLSRSKIGLSNRTDDVDNILFKMGICGDTLVPTTEPTQATVQPSTSPTTLTCNYNGQILNVGDTVENVCEFGYYGDHNIGYCLSNGEIGNWVQGCYKISFSDEFYDFDDNKWTVHSTGGVSGRAALAIDGSDESRFIPANPAFVGVIRSKQKISWPLRTRAVLQKRTGECNLWSIALGPQWKEKSSYSSRLTWSCLGGSDYKQLSLFNGSYRIYDSKCWNEDTDKSMDVIYTIRNYTYHSTVTTSISDCASLRLFNSDILSQNPWQDAYLWLGSYTLEVEEIGEDSYGKIDEHTIVGRFDSIGYTKFFTDFDGLMTNIWNPIANDAQLKAATSGEMYAAEKITSDGGLYEFNIPFNVRLSIQKPGIFGVFSHFISLGGIEYINETTDNIVQIVWDDGPKQRFAITSHNIYQTAPEYADVCQWKIVNSFDVLIQVHSDTIILFDELCNSTMVIKHNLVSNQTIMTIGFSGGAKHVSNAVIQFTNIEVYQLPLLYDGIFEITQDVSNIVDDITSIYKRDSSSSNLKVYQIVLIVLGIVVCCIGVAVLYFCVVRKRGITTNKNQLEMEYVDKKFNTAGALPAYQKQNASAPNANELEKGHKNKKFNTAGALPAYQKQNASAPNANQLEHGYEKQKFETSGMLPKYKHQNPSAPAHKEPEYKEPEPGQYPIQIVPSAPSAPNEGDNEVDNGIDGNTKGGWGYEQYKQSDGQMTVQ